MVRKSKIRKRRLFGNLTPYQFENLVHDTLIGVGLRNSCWRTPGRDGGRDIEGQYFGTDLSGFSYEQRWYVECKHYSSAVDWPTVWEKISYAQSNLADALLVVASSSLSPQCLDEVAKWNEKHPKPTVRFWNGTDLDAILKRLPELRVKYGLSPNPKSEGAMAVVPLTQLLVKATQSAYASSIFAEQDNGMLELAAALSDLMGYELKHFASGKFKPKNYYRPRADKFEWVDIKENCSIDKFDRYTLRALLTLYRVITSSHELTISPNGDREIVVRSRKNMAKAVAYAVNFSTIAVWGDIEATIYPDKLILTQR